jgi:hypothetical protein
MFIKTWVSYHWVLLSSFENGFFYLFLMIVVIIKVEGGLWKLINFLKWKLRHCYCLKIIVIRTYHSCSCYFIPSEDSKLKSAIVFFTLLINVYKNFLLRKKYLFYNIIIRIHGTLFPIHLYSIEFSANALFYKLLLCFISHCF